jgi:hypothetical protein
MLWMIPLCLENHCIGLKIRYFPSLEFLVSISGMNVASNATIINTSLLSIKDRSNKIKKSVIVK